MNNKIKVRRYQEGDAKFLSQIYYTTIHTINAKDYTKEQRNAWAPRSALETDGWEKKWLNLPPFVALIDNKIVGFAEFESNGHIDCFYVHHEFQGCGIGSLLMREIEKEANDKALPRIYAEVSITARPFFEAKGFNVVKQQTVTIRGVELTNFIMEKYYQEAAFKPRFLSANDIPLIVEAFNSIDWNKPASLFEQYLEEAETGQRLIWVIFVNNQFTGYITLKWNSLYQLFKDKNIPEIMDLNVLPSFRLRGIGSMLLATAEKEAATKSKIVGIGVGLYAGEDGGYGAAQRLYVKRGYIPDGKGVTYNYQYTVPGNKYPLDDDMVLWFTKNLK